VIPEIGQSETRIACGSHVWKWIITNVHSRDLEDLPVHRCFLPSFSSFGWGFSEENIKCEK
jgi:hypothetical protein